MFEALRKMIFPIIIVVLVFFVAMIVLQWGMGMSSRRDYSDLSVAAIINGEEVDWRAYRAVSIRRAGGGLGTGRPGEAIAPQKERLPRNSRALRYLSGRF